MPYEFEDLSKDVAKGAEDVKKGLDGIAQAAEKADEASAKLSDTQRSALQISDKFAASLEKSTKGMSVLGKAGRSASKAVGLADVSLRSAASSMFSIGAGAKVAASGFKNVSSAASSFAQAERDVAGIVREVEGLGEKLKEIKSQDISLKLNLEGTKEIDDLISKTEKLRKLELKEGKQSEKYDKKEEKAYKKDEKADNKDIRRLKLKQRLHLKMEPKESKPIKWEEDPQGPGNWSKDFIKKSKEIEYELDVLNDDMDDLTSRKRYVELSIKGKKLDLINDFKSSLSEAEQKAMAVQIRLGKVEEVAASMATTSPLFAAKLAKEEKKAAEVASELLSVERTLNAELGKKAKTVGDLIKKSFLEGKKEVLGFAGGLGSSAVGMMAVGVASVFLAQKAGEMAKAFQASAVSLASFNNDAALAEKTIMGMAPSLDNMRKSLNLTREQSLEFFETVRDGVNHLGMSREAIMDTASAFQEAFGGDPTKRLKQYVDLLKEIPTLDTDIQVGAKMDDQSAALFALAKEGKVDVVMELQTAGVLGGDAEELPGKEILKSNQKAEYYTQAIGDALLNKIYPTWGPYLSTTADGVTKVVAGVVSIAAGLGGLNMLLYGTAFEALSATTINTAVTAEGDASIVAAIAASSGKEVAGKLLGSGTRVPEKMGFIKQFKLMGTSFVGNVKTAGKALLNFGKTAGGVAGLVGVAFVGAGMVMRKFSSDAEKAGDVVGAAGLGIAASMSDVAGKALVGAAIGSIVPVIGTAAGAVAGALYGVVTNFDSFSKDIGDLRMASTDLGKNFVEMQKMEMKYTKKNAYRQKALMRSALMLQEGFARNKLAVDNAKLSLYDFEKKVSEVDLDVLSSLGGSVEGYDMSVKRMTESVNKRYEKLSEAVSESFKDIMSKEGMLPEQRKQLLDDLHMKEMESVKAFVDGVKAAVDALYRTPKMVKAEKEIDIMGGQIGMAQEAGVVGEAMDKMLDELAKSTKDAMTEVISNIEKSGEVAGDASEKMVEKVEKAKVDMAAIYGEVSKIGENSAEKIKKAEEDVAKRRAELAKQRESEEAVRRQASPTGTSLAVSTFGSEEAAKKLAEAEGHLNDVRAKSGVKELIESLGKIPETTEEAAATSKEMSKKIKKLSETFEEADAKIPKSVATMAANLAKKRKDDITQAQIDVATPDRKVKMGKDMASQQEERTKEQVEYNKALAKFLRANKASEDVISEAETKMAAAGDFDKLGSSEALSGSLKAILNHAYNTAESNEKIAETAKAELNALQKYDGSLREFVTATDASLFLLDNAVVGSKKWEEAMAKLKFEQGKILGLIDTTKTDAEKELVVLRGKVAIAKMTGNASKEIAELQMRESKTSLDVYNAAKKAVSGQEAQLKLANEAHAAAKAALVKKKQQVEENTSEIKKPRYAQELKNAETAVAATGSLIAEVGVGISKAVGAEAEALADVISPIDAFNNSMRESATGVAMLAMGLDRDLGDALANAAPYAKDLGKYADESFDMAVKAAKKELELTKKRIADSADAAMEIAQNNADKLRGAGRGKEADEVIRQAKMTMESQKRLENEKAAAKASGEIVNAAKRTLELKKRERDVAAGTLAAAMSIAEAFNGSASVMGPMMQKQLDVERARLDDMREAAAKARKEAGDDAAKMVAAREMELAVVEQAAKIRITEYDNAKKVIELKKKEVDIVEDVLQTEMDYLQDVGGSFGRMAELQADILGMERQKVGFAKEALDAAIQGGASGLELLEKQAEVRKAELGYQRKALGAQKSMLDKFLGAAFGGLSDVGAKRGVGSDRALLGLDATRVVSPSGLFSGAGGPTGTLEERTAKMQFSAESGKVGLIGGGPKKAKIEEELAKSAASTAKDMGHLNKKATTGHSIYTEDYGSQSILSKILAVLNTISSALTGGAKASAETTNAVEETKKAVETASGESEKTGAGSVEKSMEEGIDNQLKLAKKGFKVALAEFALAKKEFRVTKKQIAAVQEQADKIGMMEAQIRKRENSNPGAGASAGIEDYSRVMAGKAMPEIEQFAKDAKDVAKYGDVGKKVYAERASKVKKNAEMVGKMVDEAAEQMKQALPNETGGYTSADYSMKYDKIEKDRVAALSKVADYEKKGMDEASKFADLAVKKEKGAITAKTSKGSAMSLGGGMSGSGDWKSMRGGMSGSGDWKSMRGGKYNSMESLGGGMPGSWKSMRGGMSGGMSALRGGVPAAGAGAVSPARGAGAGSSPASSDNSVSVKGEVKVQFNNKMFEDTVATIMQNQIRNPVVQQAMDNVGFMKR